MCLVESKSQERNSSDKDLPKINIKDSYMGASEEQKKKIKEILTLVIASNYCPD